MDESTYREFRFRTEGRLRVSVYARNEDGRELKLISLDVTSWLAERAQDRHNWRTLVSLRTLLSQVVATLSSETLGTESERMRDAVEMLDSHAVARRVADGFAAAEDTRP